MRIENKENGEESNSIMVHARKTGRRTLILLLIAVIMLPLFTPPDRSWAEEMPETSFGQVLDMRKMEIGPSAEYTWYDMNLPQGPEKVHFVEFDPRNPALELQPGKTDGKVYGMQGVTKMASDVDQSGNRVIAAINADFYDMSTGVPIGLFMGDGEILTSPPDDWYAFGMKSDGTTIYGPSPRLERTLTVKGNTLPIHHINRMRFNSEALILYTPSFHTNTATNDLGDEVELEVLEGEVKSGQTMRLRVAAIHKDKGSTPLTEGRVVLSASGKYREMLSGLQIGDEITASFALEEAWSDVKMAVGGQVLLVKDGVPLTHPDQALFPRVAIGTKADGTVIMLEVDGRAPGFSEGVTFQDLGLMLKDMGVVDALLLDGGGSATFVARLPGEPTRKILNRPSDGAERKTANGILLVNKAPESAAAELVVQPNLERVLAGSSFRFKTAAVDEYTHPAALEGTPSWSVDSAVGSMDSSGLFTAGTAPGLADITVSAGGLTGTGQVEVVNELTKLKFPDTVKTFTSGDQQTLSVTALRNGQVIQADNRMFEWRVEGPIGSIDENGMFTATNETEQSGRIIASYQGIETSMDVHVGLPPVVLEDFENGLDRYLPSAGARFVSTGVSEETNEDFVRFGNKSAKLEYDFTGTIGTSGAYIQAKSADDYIEIPGYPEKISMWVYGDGNKHWLRAQVLDGNNGNVPINFVDEFVGVDFTGWRYLEAEVPQGRPLPLRIAMPARYMESQNDKKDTGVIYIDQIRALYGPANDDLDAPVIKDISPADGSTITTNTPRIQAFGEDFGYDPAVHPGTTLIDPDKIRLYVDGELVQHTLYPPKGQIHYTPAIPLTDGVHAAKLKIRDMSGNLTEKEWTFTVDTGAPKIVYDGPDSVYAGNTYTLDIRAVRAAGIRDGYIEFGFDPTKSEDLQAIAGEKLTDSQLQSTIDPASGTVRLDFSGLETSGLTNQDFLAQIRFRVKSDAADKHRIAFRSGAMQLKNQGDTNFRLYGLPVESEIRNHLRLAWDENGIVQGFATTLQVTDEAGTPVEGASVMADGIELGLTDAAGKLETNDLTDELKEYRLQAVKGEAFYSPVLKFKVSPLAGNPVPTNISVTMGADPSTSRAFTWHTHLDMEQTIVEIVKKSEFIDFSQSNVIKATGTSSLFNTWDIGTVRVHKAVADNLEPGTEYVYRVGDGSGNTSSQGTFRTAATSGESFKFLYFADSQSTNESGFKLWGDIANKAAAEHPDSSFMVHTGDMVEDGFKEKEWNMWFNAAQQQLLNTTIVSVVGNHEVTGPKKNDYFLAHFNHPQNGIDSLKGSNYSFDYLNAHFAVLNSEYDIEQQREWLRGDLASTSKKWKIVIFHRGSYGSIYDSEQIRNSWTPVLDEFQVDLALNGHDHVYMRTYPMKGNQPVGDGEGTTYVVAGSTGPKFYQVVPRTWQKITDGEQVQMYASIEIDGDELRFVAKAKTDRIVDRFTLVKTPPQSVVLDRLETKLPVGGSIKLNATVLPERANDKTVTWSVYSSSTENVVTVDTDGLVTAHQPGTAVVRASTVAEAVYADSVIEVVLPSPDTELTGVELHGRDHLDIGDADQTVAEAVYNDGSRRQLTEGVQYGSSDPQVATVDEAGVIRALAAGTAVITAEFAGMSGQYTLTVEQDEPAAALEHLDLNFRSDMTEGDTQTVRVTGIYSDGTSVALTDGVAFGSSNPSVASVNANGTILALREGATLITAEYMGISASAEITVGRDHSSDDEDDEGDGNNGPTPPASPTPPSPPVPPGRIVVKQEQLRGQNAENGELRLHYEEPLAELVLPGNTAELLGNNALVVHADNMTISIPAKVLRSLANLAEPGQIGNLTISLKAGALPASETARLLSDAEKRTGAMVKAGGEVIDFSLSLTNENGSAVSLRQFKEPVKVSFQMNSDVDKSLSGVYRLANDGTIEYLGGIWDGEMLAGALNRPGKYAVLEYTKTFSDLPADHWAFVEIRQLAAKHLVQGVSTNAFQPNRQVTRAEFAAMLVRLLGLQGTGTTGFTDVNPNEWYADEVSLAAQAGIANGVSASNFAPGARITRQEMAAMVVRAYEYQTGQLAGEGPKAGFTDLASAPQWARSAISQAYELGLIEGRTATSFRPQESGTRAESAMLIFKLMRAISQSENR